MRKFIIISSSILTVLILILIFITKSTILIKYPIKLKQLGIQTEIKCYGEYIVDRKYLKNIEENTSVSSFMEKAELNTSNVVIYDQNDNVKDLNDIITTGSKVRIQIDDLTNEYIIVVAGDINKDGTADIADVFQINKYRLEKKQLTDECILAADVDYNGEVDFSDILKINKYRIKKSNTLLPDEIKAVEISLKQTSYNLNLESMAILEANVKPKNVTNNQVQWTSSNQDVVEINQNGVVNTKKEGVSTITATTLDGTNLSATAEIRVIVPLKQITLNSNSLSLNVGDKQKLIPTLTPDNATNKEIEWSSSNENVVIVDDDGLISAISEGNCVITVEGENGIKADCEIVVNNLLPKEILIDNLQINPENIDLNKGNNYKIQTIIQPENATNKTLKWESSNSRVAMVDEKGIITAVGGGTAYITVTTNDGSNISKTITINVNVPVENIQLTPNNVTLNIEQSQQIYAKITPENATNKEIEWISSDERVAIVDENGNITAKKIGEVVITAKTKDESNIVANANVKVVEKIDNVLVSSIVLNEDNVILNKGENKEIQASVVPSNATNKILNYVSSNEAVAIVDNTGKIIGVDNGETTITISSTDGSNIQAKLNVKVITPIENIVLNQTKTNIDLSDDNKKQLVATIIPETATDKTIEWTSSDERIAIVDSNGLVTAKANGNVIIKAKTQNGKTVECQVIVETSPKTITLNTTSKSFDISVTPTFQLKGTITPSTSTDKTIIWSSSDTSIATVNKNGLVTLKSNGTTTIKAQTNNGKEASCKITIKTSPTALSLNKEKVTIDLSKESSVNQQLSVKYTPTSSNIKKNITWTSSDESVVTVNENGVITGKSNGTATITAITTNEKKAECKVTVQTSPTNIYFEKNKSDSTQYETIKKGKTKTIQAVIEPNTANVNTAITYSLSGNSKVASVDSSTGKITATQAGVMKLTAKTANGKSTSIYINVKIGNSIIEQDALTDISNDSVYSKAVTPYKAGNTMMHMQGFDIDSNGAIFYAGNCDMTNRADQSYVSHYYKANSKNERPTDDGMKLIYVGHQDSIDVEEDGDKRYIWGTTFAAGKGGHGFTHNYAVSRIPYTNNTKLYFGPGKVIEKNENKNTIKTYNNISADNFVYYDSTGNIRTSLIAAIDEENGLLCINYGKRFYIYDLEEALSLPNEKQSDMKITKYEDPTVSDNTITEYIDFYAKNLGYKQQSDGNYVQNIIPLTSFQVSDEEILSDSRQGIDLDGDYIYCIEGNKQPTRISAFDYMYRYNGNVPRFRRVMVTASYTKSFYSQMGPGVPHVDGAMNFYETEGIKVKNGKVFCGYMVIEHNANGVTLDRRASILMLK